MDILTKLFGSDSKVKILRLFLFNPETVFSHDEIVERCRVSSKELKKELPALLDIELIKRKPFSKEITITKGKKTIVKKIKGNGYTLDSRFTYLQSLKNLLITVSLHSHEDIAKRVSKVGKVKMLILAGMFIQDWDSRVDMLIVGDELDEKRLEKIVSLLESEIGKQLSYSMMDTTDFEYRLGVYDKLVRDIIDFPHVKVVDRLNIV